MSTAPPSRAQSEAEVRSWGFNAVFTWTDSPNAYYPPHKHAGLTTHLIRRGTMTIAYPHEPGTEKQTFGPGARIDVPAGRVHEVWIGEEGCEYVVGE
ncbi:hypothetical protein VTO42DRAFT_6551 [Malbranchea cinnamomea]